MITIYSDSGSDSTMVSNLFIDEYMERANDAQIKIYLYLLRMMGTRMATSVSDLADRFNHTEKDVVRSLRYWEKQGLMNLRFSKENDLVSVCLCRPSSSAGNLKGSADTGCTGSGNRVLSFSASSEAALMDPPAESVRLLMAAGGDLPSQNCPGPDSPGIGAGSISRNGPVGISSSSDMAFSTGQTATGTSGFPGSSPHCHRTAGSGQHSNAGSLLSVTSSDSGACSSQALSSAACNVDPAQPGSLSSASCTADPAPPGFSSSGAGDLEALEKFHSDPGKASLLFVIEQYIGKPLSLNELRIIYHISEDLHFSEDMIDYLLQYCVDRGKKDFRYIGKIAENWAAEGIMTPAQAENYSTAAYGSPDQGKSSPSGGRGGKGAGKSRHSSARQTGKNGKSSRSPNCFNQFEQNSYDFDALEEELLSSHDS